MRAHQAHPRGDVTSIAAQYLRIKRRGLVVPLGLHQDARKLQLGIRLQAGSIIRKRQRQRLCKHALRIGNASWA